MNRADSKPAVARLPLRDPAAVEGEAGEALRNMAEPLNLFRVLAHAPTCMVAQMRLGGAILSRQSLGHRERELLVLLVARLQGVDYEWVQHVPIALELGVSPAAIAALERLDLEGPFGEADRALLAFARQVVEAADADDTVFARVREHLTERQVMEAILAIGFYMTMARVLNVARAPLDEDRLKGLRLFRQSQATSRG